MRKFFAILLLALMVFNLTGYRILFSYLEDRAQAQMAEKLDNNLYSKTNLTELKVALHLPYISNNKGFERYDGSITLNGITYDYVERKVENDTLILHCIPNRGVDNVKLARSEYGKSVNDIQSPQKSQKNSNSSLLLNSLACAGYKLNNFPAFDNILFATQLSAYKSVSEKITGDRFAKSHEQPPDIA